MTLRYAIYGGEEKTYQEIGEEVGLSRERVRQILMRALRMLRHPAKMKEIYEHTDERPPWDPWTSLDPEKEAQRKRKQDEDMKWAEKRKARRVMENERAGFSVHHVFPGARMSKDISMVWRCGLGRGKGHLWDGEVTDKNTPWIRFDDDLTGKILRADDYPCGSEIVFRRTLDVRVPRGIAGTTIKTGERRDD